MARLKRRGREARDLGTTLLHEPRQFPAHFLKLLKRSFRTMWDARGGGFYACGFVVTFIWLEITTLVAEISGSDGIVDFFTEQFVEFLFRFSVQSITNTVQAFIWPVLVLEKYGGMGIAGLLLAYLLFSKLLKEPLTDWLFSDDTPKSVAPSAASVLAASSGSRSEDEKPG